MDGSSKLRWLLRAPAAAVAVALFAAAIPAHADTVAIDADAVTPNPQSSLDLGDVAPGGTLNTSVAFILNCDGRNHVDNNQSVPVSVDSATLDGAPAGAAVVASGGSIGPVPATWPDDASGGPNCPSIPPTMTSSVNSSVNITAPATGGSHSVGLRYRIGAVTPPGSGDNTAVSTNILSVTFTFNVVVADSSAPETTITASPASLTNSTNAEFGFSSSEDGSTFECKLDNDASFSACTSPTSYISLGTGNHTFLVRATDGAGNTDASPASHAWTIDTTAPQTTIDSSPALLTNSTTAQFAFGADETDSTFQCKRDNAAAFSSCTSPITYTDLGSGDHTFAVKATDAAGNTDSTEATHSWTIDTSAPGTSVTSGPSNPSNSKSPSIAFSSDETGSTFECALDEGAYAACSSPELLSDLDDGAHIFSVRATDGAGNTDSTPASHSWSIDTLAPSVSNPDLADSSDTGTSSTDNKTKDSTPTLAGTAEPGAEVRLIRGGEAVATSTASITGAWSFTSATLGDGTYAFAARARDAAGNETTSDVLTLVIDTTNPTIAKTSQLPQANAAGWNKDDVTVTWSCSDSGSGAATPVSDTVSTEGSGLTASGTCTDAAGNSAGATVSGIQIDKTAPTVNVTGIVAQSYELGSVPSAACSTEDALSGVATSAQLAGPTQITQNANGVGSWSVECTGAADYAGNTNTHTVIYSVIFGRDGNIRQPINPDNTSAFSRGKSVPVKFGLDSDENLVNGVNSSTGFVTTNWVITGRQVSCPNTAGSDLDSDEQVPLVSKSGVRYDAAADQYIYNADFSSKAVGTCWKVVVNIGDGSLPLESAIFKLQR